MLRSFRPVLRSRLECHASCVFDSLHKWGTWRRGAARAVPFPRRLRAEQWQRGAGFAPAALPADPPRFRNQAGFCGAPASEATITKRPPSSRYRTGTVRSRRDLRPVVVSRRIGAPAILPITRPPLRRYSQTFNAMKALVSSFMMKSPHPRHARPVASPAPKGQCSKWAPSPS